MLPDAYLSQFQSSRNCLRSMPPDALKSSGTVQNASPEQVQGDMSAMPRPEKPLACSPLLAARLGTSTAGKCLVLHWRASVLGLTCGDSQSSRSVVP